MTTATELYQQTFAQLASLSPDADSQLSAAKGWEQRFQTLIKLGKILPTLPVEYHLDAALVPGCESKVWLHCCQTTPQLQLLLDSETKIIRGVLVLIQEQLMTGKPQHNWQALFEHWQLSQLLSPSRSNGIRALLQQIDTLQTSASDATDAE